MTDFSELRISNSATYRPALLVCAIGGAALVGALFGPNWPVHILSGLIVAICSLGLIWYGRHINQDDISSEVHLMRPRPTGLPTDQHGNILGDDHVYNPLAMMDDYYFANTRPKD